MRSVPRLLIVALAIGSADGVAIRSVLAAINTSGSVTGGGTPYNGVDDPWMTSDLNVGHGASGSMTITGVSDVITSGSGQIGLGSGAFAGSVTVDGAGSTWTTTNGNMVVGNQGAATLTITNGGQVNSTSGTTLIGLAAFDVGFADSVVVDGAGSSLNTHSLRIAPNNMNSGSLTITNGGSVIGATNGSMELGANPGSTATVTVGGGTATSTLSGGEIHLNDHGKGTLNINAGGVVISHLKFFGCNHADSRLNFDGGELQLRVTHTHQTRVHIFAGGATIDVSSADPSNTIHTFSNTISGPGELTKTGNAILEFTGVNTYTGNRPSWVESSSSPATDRSLPARSSHWPPAPRWTFRASRVGRTLTETASRSPADRH